MGKVLVLTVGGSPQPLITSVNTLKPDRVVFVCSRGQKSSVPQVTGQGTPCEVQEADGKKVRLPNLVTVLRLSGVFDEGRDIVRVESDDASECYRAIAETIKKCLAEGNEVTADYTGGTKTMSVSLAMAAMDYGVPLYLTTGSRKDLVKVTGGESTELVSTHLIDLDRRIEQFLPLFLSRFDYSAAIDQVKGMLKSLPLDGESKKKLHRLQDLCGAFEAWDGFQHLEAWSLIEPHMGEPHVKKYGIYLKRIIQSRAEIDDAFDSTVGISGHGHEIVEDLVANAERRATQKRYDDAVGRLYRAIELVVQIHLLQRYGIKTGDVDLGKLPEDARPMYEQLRYQHNQNRIRLGLRQNYELLKLWSGDPLLKVYTEFEKKVKDVLLTRNNSLFAHGFKPLSPGEYEALRVKADSFIRKALEACCPVGSRFEFLQLPRGF